MGNILAFLKPAPIVPRLPNVQVADAYFKHRVLNFIAIFIGYLSYYLLRNNLSLAMPYLAEMGFSKAQLGGVLSVFPLAYGVSKFLMGNLSDHSNPRFFLSTGLIISAIAIFMIGTIPGWVTCIPVIAVFMFVNGCVQGMGAPPCYRTITHWFPTSRRGRVTSVWCTSHNVGVALLGLFITAYVGQSSQFKLFSWEAIFWAPALVAFVFAIVIILIMVDTPQSVGLPPVEEYEPEYEMQKKQTKRTDRSVDCKCSNKPQACETKSANVQPSAEAIDTEREMTGKEIMFKYVLVNRTIWLLALAEIFIYLLRYGVSNWTPLYLSEELKFGKAFGGTGITIFESAGLIGILGSGYLSDKFFRHNQALLMLICFVLVGLGTFCFHYSTTASMASFSLAVIGTFIYGPILLIGVQAMDVVPKKAVGTAIGLLGLFGYWGGNISASALLGYIGDRYSWNGIFNAFYIACAMGVLIFALIMFIGRKNKTGSKNYATTA